VRGYGLVDSTPVNASPGQKIQLSADLASSPEEAAEVYPANYWYSLLELPSQTVLNLIGYPNQASWENRIKLGCELCHQVGDEHTRDLTTPLQWDAAWSLAGTMNGTANGLNRDLAKDVFSDWGARIADGEVPSEPPRPQGIERNVVITERDWGDGFAYAHDEVSTDKRNPNLYPNGMVWGVDLGEDRLLAVDPTTNEAFEWHVPTMGGFNTPWCDQTYVGPGGGTPLPNGFCTLNAYINPANPHNPMMDNTGKVYMTTQIRREWAEDLPDFCLDGGVIQNNRHHRQLGYFDTSTEEFVLIDTCGGTHHLQFASNGKLWLSGDSYVLHSFDPSMFDPDDPTTLAAAEQWWEMKVDSDGDGIADTPTYGFNYGVIANPDGTIWTANPGYPGNIKRFDPDTEKFEIYEPADPEHHHGPRGIDADTEGNIWTCLGGSSHVAKFDRSACGQTYGTGDQCPEGWQYWEIPGPHFKGLEDVDGFASDFHYYAWVDRFNTFGLGENEVFCNGTGSDSLIAFNPETHVFTRIRVPYPLNFYQRGLDGRIDDPDAGWKGRGLWVDNGGDPIGHAETEIGQVCHVQLRPDPLAH
jgi:hypothetical protein